jgi:hypothetical protein
MTGQDVTVTEMHVPHFVGPKRNIAQRHNTTTFAKLDYTYCLRPLYVCMEKLSPKCDETEGKGFY